MLKDLWKTRQKTHIQAMLKYMKYIFNDHFVIVLFICLGFLMIAYAHFVLHVTAEVLHHPLMTLGLVGLFSVSVLFGRLATLLKPADTHFLSVMESQWDVYMTQAKWYSMIIPSVWYISLVILSYPLIVALNIPLYYCLFMIMFSLKWIQFTAIHYAFKSSRLKHRYVTCGILFYSVLVFAFAFYVSMILAIALSLLGVFFTHYTCRQGVYQWEKMLSYELKRQNSVFRFIQLFVDVPIYHEKYKPRKYLNACLSKTANMHTYIMERLFLRASHYLGLSIRLSLISIVFMLFLPNDLVKLGIGVATAYITAFQLLPLYVHYQDVMHLLGWPMRSEAKKSAFLSSLKRILSVQTIISHVFLFIIIRDIHVLISVFGTLLFIYIILPLYIKQKIDKM
ncbi:MULTISPECIES: ABC transporter permease [unclassified Granulicatella]|uniref:ABC transporter permease n=1 Tax=unclassified Granulicatella TaxID=2630493 RepID=UPI001074066E|nr:MULTISPECIES: ABC transporter permease [unclassified Granulicatella]MBF0779708.1 ABC transporter permease [Granulicatella sp. 19428wC4_WM01]TFU96229.1 ABC transporter permease [Granulicatella sp. WM01]